MTGRNRERDEPYPDPWGPDGKFTDWNEETLIPVEEDEPTEDDPEA